MFLQTELTDNMVVTRLEHLGEYEIERLKKYHKSYVKIKEFLKNK